MAVYYTPPSRLPTWATGGGADVTDPGSSKQSTGWVEGEAPAADHTNWLLNQMGEYLEFLQNTMAPYIAYSNLNRTSDQPWGTDGSDRWIGQYLYDFDRFYVVNKTSVTDDVECWDSADGITWSTVETIDTSATVISNYVSDGTNLYVIADDELYQSTTGLVADLAAYDTLPAAVSTDGGLVYDQTNSRFIYSTNGTLYSSADGDTWISTGGGTLPDGPCTLAHNPNSGLTVAHQVNSGTNITDLYYTSDGGVNWTQDTSGPSLDFIIYSAAVGAFVGRTTTTGALQISEGDTVQNTWGINSNVKVDAFINTPEVLLFWDDTSAGDDSPGKGWYAIKNRTAANDATHIFLGHLNDTGTVAVGAQLTDSGGSQGGYFCGGNTTGEKSGKTIFFPGASLYINYSQYGSP